MLFRSPPFKVSVVVFPAHTVVTPLILTGAIDRLLMVILPALVAVPAPVTTVIRPVVVFGTTAVICVALLTVYELALTPLNLTAVTPIKLVPVITTEAPTHTGLGVKFVMLGVETIV